MTKQPAQQLKILIATGIFPPDIGGPATMLEALAAALVGRGFQVRIITYAASAPAVADNSPDGYAVTRIFKHRNLKYRHLKYFLAMLKLALAADLIYVTDTYSVGRFAYLIKKLLGKKYIVRFAGDSAWESATSLGLTDDYIVDFQAKTYGRRIEALKQARRKILVEADRVIAVSKFMAEIARRIGVSENKIKLIYNAVDFGPAEKFNENEVKAIKARYGRGGKLIVTACRLTPWKGVGGLIKILPELREKIGQVNLMVLGEGTELKNLQALAEKLKVSKQVHFLGKIRHEKIINYFRAADLFILNTHYEGLSHTLLEAMTAGVPLVASNIGGNPEVIDQGENGLLVGYNNQQQLLEAAVRLLSDDRLASRLVARAKDKLKNFSWQENIEATVALLNELGQRNK